MSKKSEREAWQEYYVRISAYERWRDFKAMTSRLVGDMKRRVRGLDDTEDRAFVHEVIRESEKLNELVHMWAEKYCGKKPEKPSGRPYGYDL